MNEEELKKDYYADRPTEPYSDDDSPNDWANIAHYAEENLERAFKRIGELEAQIKKMKCCENCGWYYLQQHWRESEEINESRMFHCGTCGNKRNWKIKEIKER